MHEKVAQMERGSDSDAAENDMTCRAPSPVGARNPSKVEMIEVKLREEKKNTEKIDLFVRSIFRCHRNVHSKKPANRSRTELSSVFSCKMKLPSLFFLSLAALSLAYRSDHPVPPTLTFLFSANLTLANPIVIGSTPFGERLIVSITDGSFSGPKLEGEHE